MDNQPANDIPPVEPVVDATVVASIPPPSTSPPSAPPTEQRKWAGKYDSVEALEAGYAEAQRVISSRTVQSFEDLTTKIGGPIEEVVATYIADGKLSLAQTAAFQNAGIGADLAERIVAGEANRIRVAQYQVEEVKTQVAQVAGGKAQQDAVLNWASNNLLKGEIEGLNARLNDPSTSVSAMRELMFMHQKSHGTVGSRPMVEGMTPPAEANGYDSVDSVVNAMRMVRKQGYVDEATRRKLANTPQNFMQGMNQ